MADSPIISTRYQDQQVQKMLAQLQAKTKNLRPVMLEIGEDQVRETDERWDAEVDPNYQPWKPLSARTIAFKRKSGRLLKILMNTGRLRESINYRATPNSVAIGTNVAYAYKPQMGVDQALRPFLGISREGRLRIVEIIQDHLKES